MSKLTPGSTWIRGKQVPGPAGQVLMVFLQVLPAGTCQNCQYNIKFYTIKIFLNKIQPLNKHLHSSIKHSTCKLFAKKHEFMRKNIITHDLQVFKYAKTHTWIDLDPWEQVIRIRRSGILQVFPRVNLQVPADPHYSCPALERANASSEYPSDFTLLKHS